MIEVTAKAIADWIGDREGEYEYLDLENCAIAQYLKGNGAERVSVGSSCLDYDDSNGKRRFDEIPPEVDCAAMSTPRDWQSMKSRLLETA